MIWDAIETMRRSPLFGMSLGSKELFHSNFIWWLCETYPAQMGSVLGHCLAAPDDSLSIVKIEREKRHTDLWVTFNDGAELIIENKVKSLPNPEQLNDIAKDNPRVKNFLLLAPCEPQFLQDPEVLSSRWHFLSYDALSDLLTKVATSTTDNYHRMLIKDYQQVTKYLGILSVASRIDFGRDTFGLFYENENRLLKELKSIRFHDWYLKRLCAHIADEVFSRLTRKIPGAKVVRTGSMWEHGAGTFGVASGMTRAQGLTDVYYVSAQGVLFQIQIQGDRYKHMITSQTAGKCRADAARYPGWFEFSKGTFEIPEARQEWNKYGDTTVYRYGIIDPSQRITDIIDLMVEEILQARSISGDVSKSS